MYKKALIVCPTPTMYVKAYTTSLSYLNYVCEGIYY